MADIDMKQKIKEVRDKFLSNNQIEDIRQNITLGVEERLKFLNTEQIKVVELLEEKHKELDNELQVHAEKLDLDRKTLESLLNDKVSNLEAQINKHALEVENQAQKSQKETLDIEIRLKKTLEITLSDQETLINSSIGKISDDITKFRTEIAENETKIQKQVLENKSYLEEVFDKKSTEIQTKQETYEKKFFEKSKESEKDFEDKLIVFETNKKEFLQDASNSLANTISKLDTKIESFIENHQMVETIIDNRLKEFRNAQKAAFEELEAALTLLERHQDETINRFKDQSQLGISQHINLPTSSSKNRGSILHQPKEPNKETINIDNRPTYDGTNEIVNKKAPKYAFWLISLTVLAFFLVFIAIIYFDISYADFLKFTRNFSE